MFDFLSHAIGPNTIFFPPYILSAAGITLIWLLFSCKLTWAEVRKWLLSRRNWVSQSTWTDLKFCLLYLVVLSFLINKVEDAVFQNILSVGYSLKPKTAMLTFSPGVEAVLATMVTMLSIDFAAYIVHILMHKFEILWSIHRIHHSAENLTPLTTYRQHPLEPILLNSARSFAAAIGLSVFHYFFPSQTPVITIYGLGAGFFFYMFTVNLHHSPVPVHYPRWLRIVFLSPHIHQLHHSIADEHHGKNFGVVFSIWDRIFRTYHDKDVELGELRFGINQSSPS